MKQKILLIVLFLSLFVLSACTGAEDASVADSFSAVIGGETAELSSATTLAFGVISLEETEWAVDETVAADLLPLWQTLQVLRDDDVTAAAELEAITGQIERSLSAEQIDAINNMELSSDTIATLFAPGGAGFGEGPENRQPPDGANAAGGGGGRGGGGGFGGRGQGGGGGGAPGGVPLDEDTLATRQAERANGAGGGDQERLAINAVIRLLQNKTGTAPIQPQRVIMELFSTEIGLTTPEIQALLAEGQTAADIALAQDADLESLQQRLIEGLEDANAAIDGEQFVLNWLGLNE